MLTGAQIRMARGYLGWSVQALAEKADVGVSTVRRMEQAEGIPAASARNLESVRLALESGGVVFLDGEDGLGPGVRTRNA